MSCVIKQDLKNLQKVSLTAHLRKVSWDIKQAIPDPNFDGIAVIDLEEWRPIYEMNWGEKRSSSVFLEKYGTFGGWVIYGVREEYWYRAKGTW
ncbi:hypothetical protein TELCIR_21687, partial [Teladorsagia circumcincta]